MITITITNIRTASSAAIYIGRAMPGRPGSPLGNPHKPANPRNEDSRRLCLAQYKRWLWEQMQGDTPAAAELAHLANLALEQDLELACWCAPKSCHGDIIKAAIEFLNA
jgi:hypothetical protein